MYHTRILFIMNTTANKNWYSFKKHLTIFNINNTGELNEIENTIWDCWMSTTYPHIQTMQITTSTWKFVMIHTYKYSSLFIAPLIFSHYTQFRIKWWEITFKYTLYTYVVIYSKKRVNCSQIMQTYHDILCIFQSTRQMKCVKFATLLFARKNTFHYISCYYIQLTNRFLFIHTDRWKYVCCLLAY